MKNTTIKDYYEELYKAFPNVEKVDIRRSVNYGWKMIYKYTVLNDDIIINSRKYGYWFHLGTLRADSIKHFNYYKRKLRRKFRTLYLNSKPTWDGYYYFGLNDAEHEEYWSTRGGKSGRPKEKFTYKRKKLFKILDEAKLYYSYSKTIMRVEVPVDYGFDEFKEVFKCKFPEVVYRREKGCKFADILVTSNNYDLV